jgi:hypothetical protein
VDFTRTSFLFQEFSSGGMFFVFINFSTTHYMGETGRDGQTDTWLYKYPGICIERLGKTTKYFSQDTHSPGRYPNVKHEFCWLEHDVRGSFLRI